MRTTKTPAELISEIERVFDSLMSREEIPDEVRALKQREQIAREALERIDRSTRETSEELRDAADGILVPQSATLRRIAREALDGD